MEDYKKKYEDALERCKKEFNFNNLTYSHVQVKQKLENIFPELKKSEDEKIRESIIDLVEKQMPKSENKKWMIAWLEKQSKENMIEALRLEYEKGKFDALQKQGKQEQLYIRFGEIPTNEKSKIYQGEVEIGTENGISVYPAFKTKEGDIVLGLNLPITKTTLYTQQHLLEYDDRPCYLVKGNYVGKDTDGQPLINNISIIEKIDKYKIKEEKQDNPINKIEPKFKVNDWIVREYDNSHIVNQVIKVEQLDNEHFGYTLDDKTYFSGSWENSYRLWTIQDAKDGDILEFADHGRIVIGIVSHVNKVTRKVDVNCLLEGNNFKLGNYYALDTIKPHPATKEQRDLLFQKMKEAGYRWDSNKKELIRYEQ